MSNPISRNAETRDLRNLEQETNNIYLSAIIISKRANQIAEKQKEELRNRLEPFINDSDNLEEIQENRDFARALLWSPAVNLLRVSSDPAFCGLAR